jgi:uncharacterized protein YjbI with pentapeptide repeats
MGVADLSVHYREMFAMPGAALDVYSSKDNAVSQAELEEIVGEHKRFLTGQRGMRAKLRAAKLDGLKLARKNLSEADLSCASLVGANLVGVNLSRASLYCADLSGCDLRFAKLGQADLRGASFKGANLSFARMESADLRAATTLQMGDQHKFHGNDHQGALFGAVDFSNAALRHASFRNAKLDHANFTDALLQGAKFRGARLRNTCFRGAVLSGVNLDELDLPPRTLKHDLPPPSPAALARAKPLMAELIAHHEWFVSSGKRGKPANIDGEDLRPLADALKWLCLAGLSARNVIAVSVDFSSCHLQAAKFDGADLREANFTAADLSGASLRRAKVAHASFQDALMQDLVLCTGQVLHFQASAPDRASDPWHAEGTC